MSVGKRQAANDQRFVLIQTENTRWFIIWSLWLLYDLKLTLVQSISSVCGVVTFCRLTKNNYHFVQHKIIISNGCLGQRRWRWFWFCYFSSFIDVQARWESVWSIRRVACRQQRIGQMHPYHHRFRINRLTMTRPNRMTVEERINKKKKKTQHQPANEPMNQQSTKKSRTRLL